MEADHTIQRQVKLARLGRDNALYLLSRAGAPRGKSFAITAGNAGFGESTEIVPASEAVIQQMSEADSERALCRAIC